ncbi:MAG TPA: hypothetical protein VMF58_09535 [Rhizomicrobium sp.]|nr:hypothetical protein [Rhizomicrobium sp.]
MSEHDLLDMAHQASQAVEVNLAQVLTITFAMVVAIYYFLHQAGLRMKLFAFVLYALGMLVYLGSMLAESMLRQGAIKALDAMPHKSAATEYYLSISHSWVQIVTSIALNAAYWILWIGITFLMFFWKKPSER